MKPYLLLTIITLSTLSFQSCESKLDKKLPILGNRDAVERTVNGKTVIDTIYSTIPTFSFTNQDGQQVTSETINQIYVADFFFTSCTSICPIMHQNMLQVYEKYKNSSAVKILSHSIDPKHDTVSALKQYASKLGVEGNMWQFVRGSQDSIYAIAQNYLISAHDDQSDPQGKVHQGWFILIDPDKRIRGMYDGTHAEQMPKLMGDIDLLLAEYPSKRH